MHSKNCTPPHPRVPVHLAQKDLPACLHIDAERKVQLTAIYKGLAVSSSRRRLTAVTKQEGYLWAATCATSIVNECKRYPSFPRVSSLPCTTAGQMVMFQHMYRYMVSDSWSTRSGPPLPTGDETHAQSAHADGLPIRNARKTRDGLDGLSLWGSASCLCKELPVPHGCSAGKLARSVPKRPEDRGSSGTAPHCTGRPHCIRLAWGAQGGERQTDLGEPNQHQ
eukprot:3251151-Amphidinium_carterae.1